MASASDLSSAVSTERVREYYNTTADRERFRLSRSTVGRIEFSVNLHFIRKYVPIGSRVLDLGGGAGPYTLALAKAGYRVVLADLSPELLALARAEIARSHDGSSVEDVLEADARDLSAFPDNSFDAVLSLGPFYHLTQQDDRIRAAQELGRVLAPAGHAFVAYMPRTTLLRWLVARASETGTWHRGELRAALTEGVYRGVDKPGSFTEGYYPMPFEMQSLMSGAGIQTIRSIASEGIAAGLAEHRIDVWDEGEAFEELLEICLLTAEEPILQGATTHIMLIGTKASSDG